MNMTSKSQQLSSPLSPSLSTASSSTREHHVYLSYKRGDTSDAYVAALHFALTQKGIVVFSDDNEEEETRGVSDREESVQAIARSRIAVVVLSGGYASSEWCLDELPDIMQRRSEVGLKVVPIFYDVSRSQVGGPAGTFGKACARFQTVFGSDKVTRWKEALQQVASVRLTDQLVWNDDPPPIERTVEYISEWLTGTALSYPGYLCGVEHRLKELTQLLCLESNDAPMVLGLWGPGGVGKSTLAKVIYDRIFEQFDACCFLENAKETFRSTGRASPDTGFLSGVTSGQDSIFWSPQHVFCRASDYEKVLVVLDGVDSIEQLKFLSRQYSLGPGSRVIITTRDKSLLERGVDVQYEVKPLDNDAALQLFSWHAFKQNRPVGMSLELPEQIVSCTNGLPFALEVTGCHLRKRSLSKWQEFADKLQGMISTEVHNWFRVCFDELSSLEKDVFLDIACFFSGEDRHIVEDVLRLYLVLDPDSIIQALIDEGLLATSGDKLIVHKLLRDLARDVVRQESSHTRLSRLSHADGIARISENSTGATEVEGRSLDISHFTTFAVRYSGDNQLIQGLDYLLSNLRYLNWNFSPFSTLPQKFSLKLLVALRLPYSKIRYLPGGMLQAPNLRLIDLSHSKLIRFPDLSDANKLEELYLDSCEDLNDISSIRSLTSLKTCDISGCLNLIELPKELPSSLTCLISTHNPFTYLPSTIGRLPNLVHLDFSNCPRLEYIPNMVGCTSLENLLISHCQNLEMLPWLPTSLKYLDASGSALVNLPLSVGRLHNLVEINLSFCTRLEQIPATEISQLQSLQVVDITGCPNIPTSDLETLLPSGTLRDHVIIDIEGDRTSTPRRDIKETVELLLLGTCLVLEVLSAAFEQLQYSKPAMFFAISGFFIVVGELLYKAQVEQVTWKRRGLVPWLYGRQPPCKPFGNTIEIFEFVASVWQVVQSTAGYMSAGTKSQNPIRMNVMFVLVLLVIVPKGLEFCRSRRAAPRPGSYTELSLSQSHS